MSRKRWGVSILFVAAVYVGTHVIVSLSRSIGNAKLDTIQGKQGRKEQMHTPKSRAQAGSLARVVQLSHHGDHFAGLLFVPTNRTVDPISSTEENEHKHEHTYLVENDNEECTPVISGEPHPVCNVIHELDIVDDGISTLGEGSFRIAWVMMENEKRLCLKTIK